MILRCGDESRKDTEQLELQERQFRGPLHFLGQKNIYERLLPTEMLPQRRGRGSSRFPPILMSNSHVLMRSAADHFFRE